MSEQAEDGCGVCVYSSGGDDNGAEFVNDDVVKARKSYRCCECRDTIPIGATYERVSGKWDGEMATYKTCLACAEIRRVFCCDGWTYTMLWEDFHESEAFAHLTTGCFAKLETAAAKAKLLDRWNAWKF